MELHKIEILIEKYFDGETSLAEETLLRDYFATNAVAQHLEQYRPMFGYFTSAKQIVSTRQIKPKKAIGWISIAASVAVLLGVGTYAYLQNDHKSDSLGTFDDPEIAYVQTQQALDLLSSKFNTGVESVQYIEEFDTAKNKIFVLNN